MALLFKYGVAQIAGFLVAGVGLLIAKDQDGVAATATLVNSAAGVSIGEPR